MNIQRCYEILEIDPNASPATVRHAYEDLLQAWDPEAFSKSPHLEEKAERKLKEIHEAYRTIVANSSVRGDSGISRSRPPYEDVAFGPHDPGTVSEDGPGRSRSIHTRVHPWARFSARILDYFLFAFVLLWMKFFRMSVFEHVPSFFFPVIMTFLWIFVEALLLHRFGTTFGKWVFGMKIVDRSLKRPGYWSACLRSLSVWCNGVGTGFFLIAPATFVISYVRLRRDGLAPWDRMGKFSAIHGKFEKQRALIAGLCIAGVLMLTFQFEKRQEGSIPETVMHSKTEDRPSISPEDPMRTGESQPDSIQSGSNKRLLAQANSYLLMGRYEEAVEAYRSIIVENPDLAEARYGLGVSHAKGRRYGEAIKELEEAVRLAPEYAEAHHILGLLYLTSGNRDAALEQHRVLVGLDKKLAEELYIYISNMDNFVEK